MALDSILRPGSIAVRITRTKPIVVVKSGRAAAGARAASSHTGALAGADVATDALLAQCGVLRAQSVEELFDVAMALEERPIPAGDRVAVVTSAGGPGIILADACESAGLDVAEPGEATRARLREVLAEEASVKNPVDMLASATSESYEVALDAVLADDGVDAAIAAFVPPLGIGQVDVAGAIVRARRGHPSKPVLAVLMGREGLPEGRAELEEAGVPAYIFPESAARALSALCRYRRWLERPVEGPRTFEVDAAAVARILERAEAAGALAYPVVLKVLSPDVVHKTDAGAVAVGLDDVVFRLQPVTPGDAREMVEGIRGRKLLEGIRGEDPADREALAEVIERVSQLVGDHESILELDINPFLALAEGGVAVDARVRVGRPPHPAPGRDRGRDG